ncbi:hypothetical protein HMPREF1508_1957 [Shuttleworthella sp. MSX8B]|nr:hypothetical protein HMPREF1508_1957 [Shuttleworthia sp. MSX8B]
MMLISKSGCVFPFHRYGDENTSKRSEHENYICPPCRTLL